MPTRTQSPDPLNSLDVAEALSKLFDKEVPIQSIPKKTGKKHFLSGGFTDNAANNVMDMTQAVIANKTIPERPNAAIKLTTTLEKYFEEKLKKQTTTR